MDMEIRTEGSEVMVEKKESSSTYDRLKKYMEYNNSYKEEHYDRITILVPKGMKDEVKKKAQEEKMTVTQFILAAVKEKMQS